MAKILFTEAFCSPENLFPFTLTRQIQDIRVGILTIREKWELLLGLPSFDKQEGDYKDREKALSIQEAVDKDLIYLIHGNILPTEKLVKLTKKLKPGEFISVPDKENIIYCISGKQVEDENKIKVTKAIPLEEPLYEINFPWDITRLNGWAIQQDLEWLRQKRKFQSVPSSNRITSAKNIFIEKGAHVEHCFLNATDGPIYIGKNAMVMEGSMLRGPLSIGENAVVKMGTRIYGATTIGPHSTVGGEIKNSVIFGCSNKAHDGYLGDAVIGEWCNMGAGTSNSNVKNNAAEVAVYTPHGPIKVGLKCGVMMGDYSRTAINTSINTGTVIGVSANVFGNGLTPKFIPSFSWGHDGIQRYKKEKALEDIRNWKKLKQQTLTETEEVILNHIFDHF
jgi:UDP-N-acetylglucosamine diphosphorylase/glucosamine-1-phosphate N-acetyltransferase